MSRRSQFGRLGYRRCQECGIEGRMTKHQGTGGRVLYYCAEVCGPDATPTHENQNHEKESEHEFI